MSFETRKRIEILKRKNRRSNFVKELSKNISVSIDSFLDEDTNEIFCRKIFKKLETIENKVIIQGESYKENAILSKQYLEKFILKTNFNEQFARVLFDGDLEIEAVNVNIREVFNNLDIILKINNFFNGNAGFILVGENLEFGICIERTEYYHEFYEWGING